MGRKALVPYALYLGRGFVNPHFGRQTGLTRDDLALFWEALQNTWDLEHTASKGMMALRGLYVFSHDNPVGNAPAHALFERVHVRRRPGVEAARKFTDYEVLVNPVRKEDGTLAEVGAEKDPTWPQGITLTRIVG